MASSSGGRSQESSGSGSGRATGGSGGRTGRTTKDSTSTAKGSTSGGRRAASRTSAASVSGATARARIGGAVRSRGRAGTRPTAKPDPSVAEPTITADAGATVPATDEALAATNARRALSPDMPRVAWLRTQLQNLEAHRRERLTKVFQLTLIAIVFMVFVLQNAEPVNVTFLLFSLNIRLIWVIVGCGLLGGVAGYLIGRPEKSLRALIPQTLKEPHPQEKPAGAAGR